VLLTIWRPQEDLSRGAEVTRRRCRPVTSIGPTRWPPARLQTTSHAISYWTAVADAPPLPVDAPSGAAFDRAPNTVESTAEIAIVFDEETTRGFQNLTPEVYKAGPTELLLAAVGLAVADWSGQRHVLVDLETHGRDNPFDRLDVTRTVGWFTSTFPVRLDLPDRAIDPGEVVGIVKEHLRSVPSGGLSYGLLRAYRLQGSWHRLRRPASRHPSELPRPH
jgi:hypothetical protein